MKTCFARLLPLVLCLLLCYTARAQQDNTATGFRELGIRFTGLKDFDFIYKKQLAENKYRRVRLVVIDLAGSSNSNFSIGLGAGWGTEKRKDIGEKIQFIRGPEFGLSVLGTVNSGTSTISLENFAGSDITFTNSGNLAVITGSFGYLLGFQYNVNEQFYVNVETIPSLQIIGVTSGTVLARAGFNTSAISLSLVYRFRPLK